MPECYECEDEIGDDDECEELVSGVWDGEWGEVGRSYSRIFCSKGCVVSWFSEWSGS